VRQPLQQGELLVIPIRQADRGERIDTCVLFESAATGYQHRLEAGEVEVWVGKLGVYLVVLSATATLVHEVYDSIEIPQGEWRIRYQREYEPDDWQRRSSN
jgi:hypothetical protein